MQLTFETMDELREMIAAMGYIKPDTISIDVPAATLEALARKLDPVVYPQDVSNDEPDPAIIKPVVHASAAEIDAAASEPLKRKRRTKAEIEADKAAQTVREHSLSVQGQAEFAQADQPKANSLDNLKPEPEVHATGHNDIARGQIAEMTGLFDGNDKLAHLNEGRQFIEQHGFPAYNETLQLADVPANIASHTPEQVSRHRAAIAWAATQKAG